MLCDLTVPSILPALILPDCVLLPHSSIPLQFSDPLSLQLFDQVIAEQRLFIIAPKLPSQTHLPRHSFKTIEPNHHGGTLCLLRAAHRKSPDSLDLIVQGLCRTQLIFTKSSSPFPLVAFQPLPTDPIDDVGEISGLMSRMKELIHSEPSIFKGAPPPFIDFLQSIDHPEVFVDILAATLVQTPAQRIQFLNSANLLQRYVWISEQLFSRIPNNPQNLNPPDPSSS